jgi:hypothetical protein
MQDDLASSDRIMGCKSRHSRSRESGQEREREKLENFVASSLPSKEIEECYSHE